MKISKADMLCKLYGRLTKSRVEDILIITGKDMKDQARETVRGISDRFGSRMIVVRSSSSNEDGMTESNAGHYESILNIRADDEYAVNTAIEQVLDSYRVDLENVDDEQVLIQPQVGEISYSGRYIFKGDKKRQTILCYYV